MSAGRGVVLVNLLAATDSSKTQRARNSITFTFKEPTTASGSDHLQLY